MVIAGDYKGKGIHWEPNEVAIMLGIGRKKLVFLNKDNVESYELITEEMTKSASSAIVRGAIGSALLGPIGLLAGLSAKNKSQHVVAVKFKDGKNSLIEFKEKEYKEFIKQMFW